MDSGEPLNVAAKNNWLQPEPVCASTITSREAELRDRLSTFQPATYGCTELDDTILGGGLSRGSVIGISADDVDVFGSLMGLQSTIRAILNGSAKRVLVITPKPLASVSKLIMSIARSELSKSDLDDTQIQEQCRACLDSVMLSVVFDIDGIWQTLSELLHPNTTTVYPPSSPETGVKGSSYHNFPFAEIQEIQDSEDEDLSQSATPNPLDSGDTAGDRTVDAHSKGSTATYPPEIIVVTHFSTLLTSLFARREKKAAHESLAVLKSQLRELCRSLSTSPLILLVNSTTEEASSKHQETSSDFTSVNSKRLEPTLRSLFASGRSLRPSRPSFGVVFSQFLDLHLLCTNISSHRAISYCCHEKTVEPAKLSYHHHSPTLVEVLQDNLEFVEPQIHNHREQRWAILDVYNQQITNACEH